MAIPNPEIYGAAETWQNAYNASGINSETGRLLKAGKIKVPTWKQAHPDWTFASSQLRAGLDDVKLTHNEPIDSTICAIGQGDKSPYRHIAVYNYRNGEWHLNKENIYNDPVNCFPFESYINTSNGAAGTFCAGNINLSEPDNIRLHVWAPNSTIAVSYNTNGNYYISPFTDYQLKSIVLQIQVGYTTNTAIPPTSAAGLNEVSWTYLENWKTTYNQYPIVACRVRAIECLSYNDVNETLSYYHYTGENNNPYRQAFGLGINHPIYYSDNDYFINYALYNLSQLDSIVYLFNTNYNIFGNGQNDYCTLPMYDRFSQYCYHPNNQAVFYKIPYSDTVYEEIMQAVASLGFCFTPTSKTEFGVSFTDADMCIPIIPDDGITTGEYTRGTENPDNDLYNADSVRDKNYDPSTHYDPNTYSDTTNWNSVNYRNAFTKRYILTASQVASLAGELWSAQSSKPADIDYQNFAVDEYLTNNPIDTIVSLKYFPCTFSDIAPSIVYLGKYQTNISAIGLGTTVRVIDFAPIEIFRHFNDFRDFEPYTQISMYIPFCGTVSIPTAECMGNYVSVKLCIDVGTGATTGYVIVSKSGTGGICVATATGTAAIDIPVSGLQSANLSQAVFNAAANWTQTQVSNFKVSSGLFSKIADLTGNKTLQNMAHGYGSTLKASVPTTLGGLINTAMSLDPINALAAGKSLEIENAKADYNLSHIEMPMRLIGSISPALSSVIESNCRLIIYRPITDNSALSHYADTVGYATIKSGTVSQFTGYTEGTIDVSGINATAEEKTAIAAAFANGVYL